MASGSRDLATEAAQAIPVTLLTGFLGSGKTTVLNHLLGLPDLGETAVLINEFGSVALDHLLVRAVDEEVMVLESGCICCSVRGDMVTALRDLFLKRIKVDIPEFKRLIIETTGLADPAPLIHTLVAEPLLAARYRLDGIVTTVDALVGGQTLDQHAESVKQVALADRLLITKTDMAEAGNVPPLADRLRALNPGADLLCIDNGVVDPAQIFDCGLFNGRDRTPDLNRWLGQVAAPHEDPGHHHHHAHDSRIASFVLTWEAPLDWPSLGEAMGMLMATHGTSLLRVKGILNIAGEDRPVALHGVQHVFHQPVALEAWPDSDRRSRLVFITRDLGEQVVRDLFAAFLTSR